MPKPVPEPLPEKLARLKVIEAMGKRCLAGIDPSDDHVYMVVPSRGGWQLIRSNTKPSQLALRAFTPSDEGELVHALIDVMQPVRKPRKKKTKKPR